MRSSAEASKWSIRGGGGREEFAHGLLAVFPEESIGIVFGAEGGGRDFEALGEQVLSSAKHGLLAGFVAVIEDGNPLRHPVDKPGLLAGKGRAEAGDDVTDSPAVQRDPVHVALDDNRAFFVADGFARVGEAVEKFAFAEDFAVGGV